MDVDSTVRTIFDLFHLYGSGEYLGEKVTQTEHMVQCAMLAEQAGASPQAVLGSLLHDIGHLVGQRASAERMATGDVVLGASRHEILGQEFLDALGVPKSVSVFVRGHVDAKRYLVYKDKAYYDKLSEASKMTLVHQGGPMTAEEAAAFEAQPQLEAVLRMREWDEAAKDPTVEIEPLEKYQALCRRVLTEAQARTTSDVP